MKTKTVLSGLFLALLILTSCDHDSIRASGEVNSLEYSIPNYSTVKVSDAFNVYVTFSDTEEGIRIEANENLHDRVVVKREGDALVIRLKEFTSVRGNATLNAYITAKTISTFDMRGASRLELENKWTVSDGRIDLSGASDFIGEVDAERLYLDMTGASNLDVFGETVLLNGKLKGSSNIRDYDLSVDDFKMEFTGASEAYLSINKTIDIKASGASALNFKGDARITYKHLTGASEIVKK